MSRIKKSLPNTIAIALAISLAGFDEGRPTESVQRGANDSRDREKSPATSVHAAASSQAKPFWAFQVPVRSPVPTVADRDWPVGDIDRFVLARQEAHGLRPVADASRETLIRRVYFDLIGLPPTIQEIDSFLTDRSAHAFLAVVDRLLDSPHFGERWGRHWLDVARYADSTGGGRSLLLPNAWRYRDYVIDSFHRDKPFDQFIREQLAGDLLPFESDERRAEQLIATAFLMIGAHNYELQDKEQLRMDVVDEQIEAVGRVFLAQTLGCARCHDHKFDPVPTADYYAMAGIFRSTKSLTPGNVSGFEGHELPVSPERRAALDKHAESVKDLQGRLDSAKSEFKKLQAELKIAQGGRGGAPETLLGIVVDDADAMVVGSWTSSKYNPGYVGDGYIHDGASGKGEKSVTFHVDLPKEGEYEVRLSYTHGTNRSPSVPVTIRHEDDVETVQIDQRVPPPIAGRFVSLGRWRFRRGGQDAILVTNEGTTGHVIVDAVQVISVDLLDAVAGQGQVSVPKSEGSAGSASGDKNKQSLRPELAQEIKEMDGTIKRLEKELKSLKENAPEPAPLTMGVKDEKEPGDFRICVRGIVHQLGDEVPRGFIRAANGSGSSAPAITAGQSGRLELAEWLINPSNPLVARVTVNRIWQNLFGNGLVRTSDNFGSTGETPSHPELLDWLAWQFIEGGWSHKKMIREIVLSRTYQLSSESAPMVDQDRTNHRVPSQVDPENRFLTRQNRRRLDAECLRDAMLMVSGQLDLTRGGPTIREKTQSEYGYAFESARRSVYLPVFRNNLPDIFEVFDFADPNTPTSRRNVSTLPSQALYLMNSPTVMDAAQHAAAEILELDIPDRDRIERAYREALGRRPTDTETELAMKYIQGFKKTARSDPNTIRLQAWSRFYQALIASLDFRYLH